MKYIECPTVYRVGMDTSIFLGGGISGCPDWQKEMVAVLENEDDLVLLNPRRANFDISDPDMSTHQIHWEHQHLEKAEAIVFWFPCETLCPITLFELGKYAARSDKKLFVGCHPDYARVLDVKVQLSIIRPGLTVHSSIDGIVQDIRDWLQDN